MKWPAVILICAGLAIGSFQAVSRAQAPAIKQRMVKVYVMAPEGNSVIWEIEK